MNIRHWIDRPLGHVLWSFRRELLVTAVFSCLANVLILTPTLYMLQIYDRVMVSGNTLTLLTASVMALLFIGVMAFAEWLRARLLIRVGVRFDEAIGRRVFHALFLRSLSQPTNQPADGLQHLLQLRQFLTGQGVLSFLDLPWTPVYIAVSWLLHPSLGLLSLAFILILAAVAWWNHTQQSSLIDDLQASSRRLAGFVQSKLRNIDAVESMGLLGGLRRHWLERHLQQLRTTNQLQHRISRQQALNRFIQYTQQSLVLAAGAWLVIRGELSMGAMIATNVLMARALQPVQAISTSWKSYFSARNAYAELDDLLVRYPEREGASLPGAPRGHLRLEGLTARVHGRSKPILNGMDVEFRPGTLTVISGPSGSGKSTLCRCMLGIWPDVQGRILLDGQPIQQWERSSLGAYLGYMPQDVQLMAGTMAENIARFGSLDPEKVVSAAKAAGIHELILRLPKGYDTPLDAQGTQLSGGYRQRVGLARALYGDPAILVLDEPNANLDDVGEIALVKALDALRLAGKTVVVITHRGRLMQAADQFVLLQDGQIRAKGSRQEVQMQLANVHGAAASTNPDATKTST